MVKKGLLRGMELTASIPVKRGTFTSQNAKEMALRRAESQRQAKIKAEQDAKEAAELKAKLAQSTPQSGRLAAILQDWEFEMQGETDIDSRAKLATAYDKLFRAWQTLTGTPNPGSAKSKRSAKPAMIQPEPISETPKV